MNTFHFAWETANATKDTTFQGSGELKGMQPSWQTRSKTRNPSNLFKGAGQSKVHARDKAAGCRAKDLLGHDVTFEGLTQQTLAR